MQHLYKISHDSTVTQVFQPIVPQSQVLLQVTNTHQQIEIMTWTSFQAPGMFRQQTLHNEEASKPAIWKSFPLMHR